MVTALGLYSQLIRIGILQGKIKPTGGTYPQLAGHPYLSTMLIKNDPV